MRYLWVQPTKADWDAWGKKVSGVTDFVGSLIQVVMQRTVDQINALIDKKAPNAAMLATKIIQTGQTELSEKGGAMDPRVVKANANLQGMIIAVLNEKTIKLDL